MTLPILPLILLLLLAAVVLCAARKLMAAWGVSDPIATTIYVLLVLAFAFWAAQLLGANTGPYFRLR